MRKLTLILVLALAACGGQIDSPESAVGEADGELSGAIKWWQVYITYQSVVLGWHDTDLGVSSSTPIQLRHASKLIRYGVYGWGYMPEFVDQVTGKTFRFLHLRPQHMYATHIGEVYPAGFVVGISGGDTHDTGFPTYSTGPHLCVQTPGDTPFRVAFPDTPEGGAGSAPPPPGSASCHSATLGRTVEASTCVQSASDGKWYTCESGSWVPGENGCSVKFGFCHSATLNKDEPARTCVQSRFDRVWYQCGPNGWETPVGNGAGPIGVCSAEYSL